MDRSLKNLEMECVDLLQLHCPHPDVYDSSEVFGILDDMVKAGKIRYYGISVETVDEALRGMKQPGVQTVQIIFNMFRLKPAEQFFREAQAQQVGILARVPSGQRAPDREALQRVDLLRRRPPPLQPRGAGIRQGRDLLRGAVRGGARGGG